MADTDKHGRKPLGTDTHGVGVVFGDPMVDPDADPREGEAKFDEHGNAVFIPGFTEGVSEDATKDELMERAAALDVEGRSSMNKAELEKAVAKAEKAAK